MVVMGGFNLVEFCKEDDIVVSWVIMVLERMVEFEEYIFIVFIGIKWWVVNVVEK